jgi:hypothetical protein
MRVARTLVVSLALLGAAPSAVLALPPSSPSASKSRRALAELTVHGHISTSSYKRSKFGTGWISQGNGCTTRDPVLLRDGLDATVASGCAVTATHWRSVYDGLVSTVRGRVDIDHIVPLANAWVSGASKWSRARRVAFANDLADSQLIAVSVRSTDRRATAAPKNGNHRAPRSGASTRAGGSGSSALSRPAEIARLCAG